MNKTEAIRAMEQGNKVTHRYFSPDEYITLEDGLIVTEEGYKVTQSVFFGIRNNAEWETDWSIYKTNATKEPFLSKLSDIKPCPFCGKQAPLGYYNAFTAYLGCDDCRINFGSVRVLYKQDELPEELKGLEKPADALIIRQEDGTDLHFPEHGYYGINCVIAFDYAGILTKWNKRNN